MKNVATILAAFALFALFSVSTAFGQMMPPVDGAVPMGTFRAQFGADKSGANLTYSVSETSGGVVSTTVWLTSGGETVYTLDVNSAEFTMPCGWAKQVPMADLIDMMARGAIRRGLELGFSHIGPNCEENPVDVFYPTCISRSTGAGCPTLAAMPGTDYSRNGYTVCGDVYNPLITLVYTIRGNAVCEGSYQAATESSDIKLTGTLKKATTSLASVR